MSQNPKTPKPREFAYILNLGVSFITIKKKFFTIMSFDYSTLPNNFKDSGPVFKHAFQFYEGDYSFSNFIELNENGATQQFAVRNGNDDYLTNVQIDISTFDGVNWDSTFSDFTDANVKPVTVPMDSGYWTNLVGDEIQVQATTRSDSSEWAIPDKNWRLQVWTKTNDIYCSSYINIEKQAWTTTFYYDGELLGTGTWDIVFDLDALLEPSKDDFEP